MVDKVITAVGSVILYSALAVGVAFVVLVIVKYMTGTF